MVVDETIASRPLEPRDAAAIRALLDLALGITPYAERAHEVIALALSASGLEHRAIGAFRAGQLLGVAGFGDLLGSDRVVRLHVLVLSPSVAHDVVGRHLLHAVDDAARAAGARFVFSELPDDLALRATADALRDFGYHEEARIPDYLRDGVALRFLRRDL